MFLYRPPIFHVSLKILQVPPSLIILQMSDYSMLKYYSETASYPSVKLPLKLELQTETIYVPYLKRGMELLLPITEMKSKNITKIYTIQIDHN